MSEKNTNKNIRIICIIEERNQKQWLKNIEYSKKFFNIKPLIFSIEDWKKQVYKYRKIDILFLDEKIASEFTWSDYNYFRSKNSIFKKIVIKKKSDLKKDVLLFKGGADDIIYTEFEEVFYWKTVVILRRNWDAISKKSILIHKSLVLDFENEKFKVNNKNVSLTKKEVLVLKILAYNLDKVIEKSFIFKNVWGFEGIDDNTRVVDQIIHKLKTKLGKEFFHSTRNKGVRFE